MGSNFAHDLASGDLVDSIDRQISIHFASNCYPPVPQFMVAVALSAINAMNEGAFDEQIDLPDGVQFRDSKTVSARDAVDQLRLDAWVDWDIYE
jgi:hypothetical protein